MKKILIAGFLILLSGCAGPFGQFYYDQTGGVDITQVPSVLVSNDPPTLIRGSHPEKDGQKMLEDGYLIVGYSSFNAGNVNENDAITQAKKVHAAVVLLYSRYTNTVSGAMPLTLPDTQTSNTSMFGSVQGYGGSATYSGSAYTTTYGTRTTYIPYSVTRYDYFATYWIKTKRPVFGVHSRDLNDELRQQIGSNKGALVIAVVKGSPAFRADILKGDILRRIGTVDIYDVSSVQEALPQHAGEEVTVEILRNSTSIEKQVKLNQIP